MLNDIFDTDELPNHKVYEAAQKVVADYMEKIRCKIDVVAAELGTTTGVLYRQLNPKDTTMPLSIDRVMAITKLTGDNRILEEVAREFELIVIKRRCEKARAADLNVLVDKANIENSDVFRVVKSAIEDGKIDKEDKEKILKEIDEAQVANAELKDRVLHLALEEK
ncbi:phage regulatory CII family protein [Aliarcobacter butzleri]|uniref:phage regulatory CII family protein n=1 Tax=Aliarcobacter butzleri TaxID=28197 RepID=UPI003AFAF4AD